MNKTSMKAEGRRLKSETGVALVVTLLMLSVITFMAIAFLAVSRRERASVANSLNQVDAQAMADAALARAQADMAAFLMAHNGQAGGAKVYTNDLLNYDMMMSHNFINPIGFTPGIADPTNVNFDYHNDGTRSPMSASNSAADWVENIANLLYDPRLPVFVQTNTSSPNLDFRYWVDYNRNGRFESNGLLPILDGQGNLVLDANNNPITNSFYGEPEWIGVLRQPDTPHGSNNNVGLGRYAYLVLPIGKTLDLNFIHNYAKATATGSSPVMPPPLAPGVGAIDKFMRNQGHGPWEINMAGFLYGLNSDVWSTNYMYSIDPNVLNAGTAFYDAYTFLRYRYNNSAGNLRTFRNNFPTADQQLFETADHIDEYSDGFVVTNAFDGQIADNDNIDKPWPGSTNYNNFYDPQDIFDKLAGTPFNDRLSNALAQIDTTNRYTFSRLLASIGTDSDPELYCWVHDNDKEDTLFRGTGAMVKRAKVNINFANLNEIQTFNKDPIHARLTTPTVLMNWDPLAFFTNTADLLLRSQDFEITVTNGGGQISVQQLHFGITNIPVYSSTNGSVRYTEAIHRLLQLAANIYDASDYTNNNPAGNPNGIFPSVFRPFFGESNFVDHGQTVTNLYIIGYTNVTDTNFMRNPFRAISQISSNKINLNDNVWGIPLIVGAKRGLPNFNEYSVSTALTVTRKLQFQRPNTSTAANAGYQMYVYSISNLYGVELWNSYRKGYTNPVNIYITNAVDTAFVNELVQGGTNVGTYSHLSTNTFFGVNYWPGNTNGAFISGMVKTNTFFVFSNNVVTLPPSQYAEAKRQFDPHISNVDFDRKTPGFPTHDWRIINTNYMFYVMTDRASGRLLDVVNLGDFYTATNIYPVLDPSWNFPGDSTVWNTNGATTLVGKPAPNGVIRQLQVVTNNLSAPDYVPQQGHAQYFTEFMNGSTPTGDTALEADPGYQPNEIMVFRHSYMANDPLVHYTLDSLRPNTDQQTDRKQPINPINMSYNLAQLNTRYSPWGAQNDTETLGKMIFKDPMVTQSDDWSFPTNKFANVGWIGRVHRGTAWQTVYLKSDDPQAGAGVQTPYSIWTKNWATSITTYPTNDWRLLDLFTVALNENAARGLLSVNQTNIAPWSAVLSGLFILTNNDNGVVLDPTNVPAIVSALNDYRSKQENQVFHRVGDILGAPQLTRTLLMPTNSGGIMNIMANEDVPPVPPNPNNNSSSQWDEVVERIPQNILSLLKVGDPRFVVYSFGQSLKPANNSLVLGGAYRGMCTNYQITGEVVTRAVCRLSNDSTPTNPKIIVESFNILPGN